VADSLRATSKRAANAVAVQKVQFIVRHGLTQTDASNFSTTTDKLRVSGLSQIATEIIEESSRRF
jgi:hypothetical protein